MLKYRDFVPKQIIAPGLFKPGEHESFEAAVDAVNQWLRETTVTLVSIETVVLPNIWSQWEQGSQDASLGTSGEAVSHWHQFIRCWYRDD
jgi:hypothetical protein